MNTSSSGSKPANGDSGQVNLKTLKANLNNPDIYSENNMNKK